MQRKISATNLLTVLLTLLVPMHVVMSDPPPPTNKKCQRADGCAKGCESIIGFADATVKPPIILNEAKSWKFIAISFIGCQPVTFTSTCVEDANKEHQVPCAWIKVYSQAGCPDVNLIYTGQQHVDACFR